MNRLANNRSCKQNFPVLVVEDEAVTRRLLEKTLSRSGHRVVCAENGKKALEILTGTFFPIVLTDWVMPEVNGLQLCRTIRRAHHQGYIYIILLTAKDSKDDIIKGLEAGADDYLTKPVNYAELIARISTGKRIIRLERSLKRAYEEIKRLSIRDPLTGCYNRGYLGERLAKEIKRAKRYNEPLTVVLGDIDHFKRVNDQYGHPAGDFVLKKFAHWIMNSIRKDVDWVARYGGEEFLLVFPNTDLDTIISKAETLRKMVGSKKIKYRGKAMHITVSFGVSGIDKDVETETISIETLIARSDECLYEAKKKGRNRVIGSKL